MLRCSRVKDEVWADSNSSVLTSWLASSLGTETLETVKCGTEAVVVSTWEDSSVVL